MSLLMCLAYLIAWSPYAILAILYIANVHVPFALSVAAPLFAKCSSCYNPVVYFLSVKRFRLDMAEVLWRLGLYPKTGSKLTDGHEYTSIPRRKNSPLATKTSRLVSVKINSPTPQVQLCEMLLLKATRRSHDVVEVRSVSENYQEECPETQV